MRPVIEVMEEVTAAIEEAMGIKTHVDISDPSDPKLAVTHRPKDNANLLRLYQEPFGKLAVDKFCAMSDNPKTVRALMGLP
jgi:hypothetical protein